MPEERQTDIREAGLKSRTAMAWLRDHHLPAEPICYTVAYEYLFTENSELKQNVDSLDLSSEDYKHSLEKIYKENILNRRYSNLSMSGENVHEYVSEILALLVDSQEELGDMSKVVDKVKSHFSNESNSHTETETEKNGSEKIETKSKVKSAIAKEVASRDELTQALDKKGLIVAIKEAFTESKNFPMSILRIDIDHFKLFNNTNGKMMGDAVLKNLFKSLSSHLKEADIISRFEEDEFIVVLLQTTINDGVSLADELRKKISGLSLKKKGSLSPVHFTISVGVAEFSGKGSFDLSMDKAKKALFRSKDLGRNCVNLEK
ncbi:GGDEF domain-containing protein [Aliikangiella coralliicola]|uniref:GGDEF domain-containing protein n=1 Tax=Aliikangiella coralliicola TaxID=2592383 RepID=UPI00143D413C|nr:GGDEF domain-containing protein [Aliikangiella coralliicola]